jgi:hypothetical protein
MTRRSSVSPSVMVSSGGGDETEAAQGVLLSAAHWAEAEAEAEVAVIASGTLVVSICSAKTGCWGGGGTHASKDTRTRVTTMEVNGLPIGQARAPAVDDEPDVGSLPSYS